MSIFVPKIERFRHKIIGVVFDGIYGNSVNKVLDGEKIAITVTDMAKKLNVTEREINLACYGIDESDIIYMDYGKGNALVPQETLIASYTTEKYLNRGRKQRIEVIKDNLYIIVSAIAIISAISSLTLYLTSIRNTQIEVNQLKKEVQEIRSLQNQGRIQKK